MSYSRIFSLFILIIGVTPAMAGEATYVDMRGKWQSTQCQPPQTVPPSEAYSDSAANDLNTQVLQHNKYVAEARAYMDCLADEANKDAKAMSYLVTESVKRLIEETQKKINSSSFQIKQRQDDNKSFF